MVHTRINERAANPNPFINFISALPPLDAPYGATDDEEARELLRALAAQLKPVMKSHGLGINSFEEYESNKAFLGRNWNNGETVELVLRDGSGRFYPVSMLLGVFCHELAHIKHMDHSPAFHKFRRQLCAEVAALQRRGYYGDGYWSAGTRLADSQRVSGDDWRKQDLPEYTCGGAYSQSRSSVLPSRRRRRQRPAGPSLFTGAQTTKPRKAGSRVTSMAAFQASGEGNVLDPSVEKGEKGSGFRKQAGSRRAREERALAAERRLLQSQGKLTTEPSQRGHDTDSGGEEDDENSPFERITLETDKERLEKMRAVMGGGDLAALRDDDEHDIFIISADPSIVKEGNVSKQDGVQRSYTDSSHPPLSAETSATATDHTKYDQPSLLKRHQTDALGDKCKIKEDDDHAGRLKRQKTDDIAPAASGSRSVTSSRNLFGNVGQQEMQHRRREGLGLVTAQRNGEKMKAGRGNSDTPLPWSCRLCTFTNTGDRMTCSMCETPRADGSGSGWACPTCTYVNKTDARKCEMCEGLKG